MAFLQRALRISSLQLKRHSQASHIRAFSFTPRNGYPAHDVEFEQAKQQLNSLKNEPDNQTKLQIYALFKQATIGKCNTKKPGALDFVGKAKWTAWNALEDISQDEAQLKYIKLVEDLAAAEGASSEPEPTDSQADGGGYKYIQYTLKDGISTIALNRPDKYNALLVETYEEIGHALQQSTNNDSVITVITGNGSFYCSGNDLSNFANVTPDTVKQMAEDGGKTLQKFVSAFIDFPKPLIAAVNGPAVGIAVTTLGLCDTVYASDAATFHTPLVALGQSAEGCSTYTFPKIMGKGRANAMLLFGQKLTARQAEEWGLVTEVFPSNSFQAELDSRLKQLASLPKNALSKSKQLIRGMEHQTLHDVNKKECDLLVELWQSDECANAVMKFLSRK